VVLAVTLGDEFRHASSAAVICGCTDMTHEDVRRMIKSQRLMSMFAVWQEWLEDVVWLCKPSCAEFHSLADWPLEYQDDPQKPLQRTQHANIQRRNPASYRACANYNA
jgi:nitrite reductase (NADH) large subunit